MSAFIAADAQLLDGWVGPVEDCGGEWLPCVGVKAGCIDIGEGGIVVPMSQVRLDLRIPQVRDRVARCLAVRLGLEVGATAPGWGRDFGRGSTNEYDGPWVLGVVVPHWFSEGESIGGAGVGTVVPGILSITDSAEALAAAWRATVAS